ncbi:hypothetical protein PDIG_61260 [Penicillium digitatum PHI26]|uniref:Uncharacterized protein n=2 Tax=Penicillium digitatum TaxID=36651 RepID=K9G8G0_PEND2|nr:hypothetical protein PDIP_70690 [Penicillium digitatum Pd1]EKV07893.1 hypothetical protein PDIP_70690 [Penicillium digitatum Pd1]EKV09516.1 hypothetical protein PDIG_61260 [Penicillium digitatum PHI26]
MPLASSGRRSKIALFTSTIIRVQSGNQSTLLIAQYDVSFEDAQDVVDTIKSITKQCRPFANPQTRFNGLSVLRKIGKTILFFFQQCSGS